MLSDINTLKKGTDPRRAKTLHNKDFTSGTYRITKPGLYVVQEDIVFAPNIDNFCKPKESQILKYPTNGPYRMGFFAVITVEVDNVTIDLNGYEIRMGPEFVFRQRFASIIELGKSPFRTGQGPADFGCLPEPGPKHIHVKNGRLGRSVHHSIRGNMNNSVKVTNVTMYDFEVAALSLHGCSYVRVTQCHVKGVARDILMSGKLSQSQFILPFLAQIKTTCPDFTWEGKDIQTIITNLEHEIECFYEYYKCKINGAGNKSYNGIFLNQAGTPDANAYGMLFSPIGVAVGPMVESRTETTIENKNIIIRNCKIENIISQSLETIGVAKHSNDTTTTPVYGSSKMISDPVGGVFSITCTRGTGGTYNGNPLSDAQLMWIACKQQNSPSPDQNVTKLLDWAKGKIQIEALEPYFVYGNDLMAHVMKGTHGIFINGGQHFVLHTIFINNVKNNAPTFQSDNTKIECSLAISGSTDVRINRIFTDGNICAFHNNVNVTSTTEVINKSLKDEVKDELELEDELESQDELDLKDELTDVLNDL